MRFLSFSLAAAISLSPTVCLAGGTGGAEAAAEAPSKTAGIDKSYLDTSCKPCEDFNKFANGGWIAKNPVPAEYPSWGAFNQLRDNTLNSVRDILEKATNAKAPKGSNLQKIGDFYATVMDMESRNAAGAKPIASEIKRVDAIKDTASLQSTLAYLHRTGIDATFGVGTLPDFKNSSQNVAIIGQGGLGLPDRDYYVKDDDKSKQIREAYVAHIANMLKLTGVDAKTAAEQANIVMEFETRLANASIETTTLRTDPLASYHMMDAAERKALTKTLDLERYLADAGLKNVGAMNMAHPQFVQEVDKMMTDVSLDNWKAYLRWRVISNYAPTLSQAFVDEDFDFNSRVLAGTKEQPPLWKTAVRATNANMGEVVGQEYVKVYFPPESKRRMEELVKNLEAALRERLMEIDWMGDETRKQALNKLSKFTEKIGYPDKWKDYSGLEVARDSYAMNARRASEFAFKQSIEKAGKPVERSEWTMTPQTVNAQYNPFNNDITFPAAILQPPFFDPNAPDAVNYGAIGAVIGHEITHGFDNFGSQFDADGNLRNWWTEKDLANFKGRAGCIEDQFSAFSIGDGTHVKGKLVSGEAIADLGGIKIAYRAYQKSLEGKPRPADVDGYTAEQLFFFGFAHVWAATHRPEFELLQTNTNEHPLPRFRLNGTVSNLPEFWKAFGCKKGDTMVRTDGQCEIW